MDEREEMLLLITEGIEWEEAVIRRTESDLKKAVGESGLAEERKETILGMLETIARESREHESTLNKWRTYFLGVE